MRPINEVIVGRFCNELCLLSDEYIDRLVAIEEKITEVIARQNQLEGDILTL